jgi:pyridinium-3,5-biscarboxylic acid mononucleotide sulfurtransferase
VPRIRAGGPALVALSGGVDSALVASLAFEALGSGALAVTLEGPAVARSEVDRAREVARAIGIRHRVESADPLARLEYRSNPPDRCYHCRAVETDVLRSVGTVERCTQYLDGVQADDLDDDRPGLRAMDEAGFVHPLLWAGYGKTEVRAEARARGLPNWSTPSDACLASRVAHGDPIDEPLLRRIETAESLVRAEGFRRVRVRVRSGAARIEVDPDEVDRLSAEPLRSAIGRRLVEIGFASVTIDPLGYGRGRSPLTVVP